MTYPFVKLKWNPAYRVIPTRFPTISLFERVAGPDDFDALYALEAMTNNRIRDDVGDISLVPIAERKFGPGSSPIMAAFTHLNPQGSRFSDGTYGVFYCAHERDTAFAETSYHSALFMGATKEPPMRLQMRLYAVKVSGEVVDLRTAAQADPRIIDPDDYSYTQGIGRKFRSEGVHAIVYPSVRHRGGECLAALRTEVLNTCKHSAYLEYNWNGRAIDAIFEVSKLL